MSGVFSKYGKPRAITDKKPTPAPAPKKPTAQTPPKSDTPKAPEVPPGPGNRSVKISNRENRPCAGAPDVPEGTYNISGADVKGLRVGANAYRPKTFAEVNAKKKPQPTTANIRFQIKMQEGTKNIEAKFATSEKLDALYKFLEDEVFLEVEKIEIRRTYPNVVIPRDAEKTLAANKIYGQIMVNVMTQGTVKFK